MSELIHNMSSPPKSLVTFQKLAVKKYILFNPNVLKNKLGLDDVDSDKTLEKIRSFVKNQNNFEDFNSKPTGYMLGIYIQLKDINNDGDLSKRLEGYDFEICEDLNLSIIVFCSTVGDLFIPNKQLQIEKNKFDKILLFLKDEVYND